MTKKEKYGDYIRLLYIYDIKMSSVAERMGVSAATVSSVFAMKFNNQKVLDTIDDMVEEIKLERSKS
jgi:predicted DNA-binding protein (UPF0251 family)